MSTNTSTVAKTTPKKRSQLAEVWRRLKKNRMAMMGLFIIFLLLLMVIFADVMFNYDEIVIKQNVANRMQPPSSEHWLGTDEFGRDILARIVHGSRVSLAVGVIAVAISWPLAVPWALLPVTMAACWITLLCVLWIFSWLCPACCFP